MSEKWNVVKVSEKNKKMFHALDSFVVFPCYDTANKVIEHMGDTVVLITPSKEIAESTKRALDEQLRKQGD